jgi:two-component system C4-dicarboxylate transport response regulator DctD
MRKASGDSKRDSGTPVLVVGKSTKTGLPLLDRCEFSATPCLNARDALKMLSTGRHQAVLCDLEMPGTGGMVLSDNVCADFPNVAVVVITPPGKLRQGILAMIAGASGYIQMPLQPQTVVASLRSALQRKRLDAAMRR